MNSFQRFQSFVFSFILTVFIKLKSILYPTAAKKITEKEEEVTFIQSQKLFILKNFDCLQKNFRVFKEKCPSYCKLKFDDSSISASGSSVICINDVNLMQKLLRFNRKCQHKILESQLKQPFLMLDSILDQKITLFEYEFYVKKIYKRNFNKKFFNLKFKKNFEQFGGEDSVDELVERNCVDYLTEYYNAVASGVFSAIVRLGLALADRLTLSLLLRQPRLRGSQTQQKEYTSLYQEFLQTIELSLKAIIDNDRFVCGNLNFFQFNCLQIRYIALNVRYIQVLLKQVLHDSSEMAPPSDHFIKYEQLWSFQEFREKVVKRAFMKIMQFDLYKVDRINSKSLFNDDDLDEKSLYLLFNLQSLDNSELDSLLVDYHLDDDEFIFDFVSSLALNLLASAEKREISTEEETNNDSFLKIKY